MRVLCVEKTADGLLDLGVRAKALAFVAREVLPRRAVFDVCHDWARYPKTIGDRLMRSWRCVNPQNLCICQFWIATSTAAFRNRIKKVVSLGSQKQMAGSNAAGIVAFVKDKQTVRNFAMRKFPRNARRFQFRTPISSKSNFTISFGVPISCPFPTSTAAVNLCPEPIG